MVLIANSNSEVRGKDVQMSLNMLQKQLDDYNTSNSHVRSTAMELKRRERIEKLIMEEKFLSQQFYQIRRDIKRYEKKYEKALKKKVKLMSVQIKQDLLKLETLKQRYKDLDIKINGTIQEKQLEQTEKSQEEKDKAQTKDKQKVTEETRDKQKKHKRKKVRKLLGVKRGVRKIKQQSIPAHKKIRIRIRRRGGQGKREMMFLNDNSTPQLLSPRSSPPKVAALCARECKIVLNKLTEEQLCQSQKQQSPQKRIQTSESSPKSSETETTSSKPNWHIKIPKSVFEEIQKEVRSPEISVTPNESNVT